jgi:putrescine transport system substrate-binding protein
MACVPRLVLLAMLAALLVACGSPRPGDGATGAPDAAPAGTALVVNVANWADYIAPGVLDEFTAATGIRVNYDTYDSQEMLETKLLAGRSGYDVVVVSAHFLERLVPAGVFLPLDPAQLPSRNNLDPGLMARLAQYDPGNTHAIGYTWGTVGIGYDAGKLHELAPGAPTDSWRLVLDPAVVARLAGCGVSIIDSPSDVIGAVLASLGFDATQPTPQQLQQVERVLLAIRPQVRKVDASSQINDLASGSICLLVSWSTNVQVARTRALEAGVAADFRYVVPKEGSVAWFDSMAIPADAPHPAAAHAFLEFMLRPEIAARNANHIGSASMNAAATPMVDAAMRDDPAVYPGPEQLAQLQSLRARSQAQSREENRIWSRFKTGQ